MSIAREKHRGYLSVSCARRDRYMHASMAVFAALVPASGGIPLIAAGLTASLLHCAGDDGPPGGWQCCGH